MGAEELRVKKGLVVYSKGSGSVIVSVQGESGEMFSVTDNLIGLIHHVSDISGIPIFEVYSDNYAWLGKEGAPAVIVRESSLNSSVLSVSIGAPSTLSLNMALINNVKRYVLGANLTINFGTNPSPAEASEHIFIFKQDVVGGRTVTWNTVGTPIIWSGGSPPALAAGADSVTVIKVLWTGQEYLGVKTFN